MRVFTNVQRDCASQVRVILTMIVRNESAIFSRCYQSVRNIIDGAVICDTGSTDGTVPLLVSLVQHLPSAIYEHEWKNFGHNRSLSATCAVEFARSMGWDLSKTYMLFVDADMVLRVRNDFDKQKLTRLGYLIQQDAQGTVYSNMRLARCDGDWQCTGVTHEYWEPRNIQREDTELEQSQAVATTAETSSASHSCFGRFVPGFLSQLLIDDRNDGGCKADKFVRDALLLEQGLRDQPDNSRYHFYLAQTYADLAMTPSKKTTSVQIARTFDQPLSDDGAQHALRSIEHYQRRIDLGGWEEEVYFSMYRIGTMWEALRDYQRAESSYREAIAFRPSRAEARCSLARLLRFLHRYDDSLAECKSLMALPISQDLLFVNQLSHVLFPVQDVAFIGYLEPTHEDFYEHGFAAIERLTTEPRLVSLLRQSDPSLFDRKMREFDCILVSYSRPLICASNEDDDDAHEDGDIEVIEIPNAGDTFDSAVANRLFPTNPSILPHPTEAGKHLMNLRLVNYFIQRPLQYTFPHEEDHQTVFTMNSLITVDMQECELEGHRIVDDSLVPWSRVPNAICGLEDVRLFRFRGRVWMTFTSCQAHASKRPQICLGRLDESLQQVEHAVLLTGDFVQPDEKNWLAFVVPGADVQEDLRILYSTDPTIILQVDVETGKCSILHNKPAPLRMSTWRGSCAPVRYKSQGTWLYMTHEVVYIGVDRIYTHRFVEMNDSFEIIRRSRPFTFFDKQVEFACGMCFMNDEQSHLLVTFGVWDREAHLLKLTSERVEHMLRPVTEF